MGEFIFGHDMILPNKHKLDWQLTSQKKRAQMN